MWDAEHWFKAFGRAWCDRKQRIAYGMGGSADSRAWSELRDILAGLPEAERMAAQKAAPRMFALYLDEDGKTANAAHPFSWFVSRWNGYFARAAATKAPPLRVVRDEVPDLPPAVRRQGPAGASAAAPVASSGDGEGGGTNQGIASRAT